MKLTFEDTYKYLTFITLNFPNAYPYGENQKKELAKSWYTFLKDYPKEVTDKAVLEVVKTCKHEPKIAHIVEVCEKIVHANDLTETELWNRIIQAVDVVCNNYNKFKYSFVEENGKTQGENAQIKCRQAFENLPPECKSYLVDYYGLLTLAIDYESQEYKKARFLKALPNIRENLKNKNNLSLLLGGNVFKELN